MLDQSPSTPKDIDRPALLEAAGQALYRIIAGAVSAEAATPSRDTLRAALSRDGHPVGRDMLSTLVNRLRTQGRIDWSMAGGHRLYTLPGSGRHTRPPTADTRLSRTREKTVAACSGWPRPTKESAASYDAAVERRAFAAHNLVPRYGSGIDRSGQVRRHSASDPAARPIDGVGLHQLAGRVGGR